MGGRGDGRASIGDIHLETGVQHTHTRDNSTSIYPLAGGLAYLGCFAWTDGENVEDRWNEFARQLWEAGLQPAEDEPAFSVSEGNLTYDHYYLISIYDD
jgi:hypothetical protein